MVFTLTGIWFKEGRLIAAGESGLSLYHPHKMFSLVKHLWFSNHGTGYTYPTILTSIPLYLCLALLEGWGLSSVTIQKLLFGLLLFISALSMYYLASMMIKDKRKHAIDYS